MVAKLELPFPILSDPERDRIIEPYGVADPTDKRRIARPAMVLIGPDGEERWRFVSRDFADRLPEDEALVRVRELGLSPTAQAPPAGGVAEPGPKAYDVEALPIYFRGARFAALAMGLRHRHIDESIADDSRAYVSELDRYAEAVRELIERRRPG